MGQTKDQTATDTLGERVMLNLTSCLKGTGSVVAFDNFFYDGQTGENIT